MTLPGSILLFYKFHSYWKNQDINWVTETKPYYGNILQSQVIIQNNLINSVKYFYLQNYLQLFTKQNNNIYVLHNKIYIKINYTESYEGNYVILKKIFCTF